MSPDWTDPLSFVLFAPLAALVGAMINGFFGRRMGPLAGVVASLALAIAFVLGLIGFVALLGRDAGMAITLWSFLPVAGLDVAVGVMLDPLALTFVLIITGVGLLIHIYSIGYMHDDAEQGRYFALLNLFVAAMLVLVLADSLLLLFVGWEGVGVSSYLLISFWYRQRANGDAGRKAFIVNRIGDAGFLLATFLVAVTFGTLTISEVNAQAASFVFGAAALTTIGILYLVAAAGKSAQFPLHVWLPDAMAGPTPVSALIHAATMVTAGIYLIARLSPLYAMTPTASAVVAWAGIITALIAAVAAIAQTDIKKILAYSTISQLGFMFVAVGAGAYGAAVFHVFTHAFFKALLFLAAGSVIHSLHGEQDIRKMGGLGRKMPWTGTTALIGTLAIAGVPLLAGFFSKEAILGGVFNSTLLEGPLRTLLFVLLLLVATLTAFYMIRWYLRVFAGASRVERAAAAKLHESPASMTLPLAILAVFSVVAGYVGLPAFLATNQFKTWLAPSLASVPLSHPALWVEWALVLASVAAAAIGLALGWWIYVRGEGKLAARWGERPLARFVEGGLGLDPLYRSLAVAPASGLAEGFAVADRDLLDRGIAAGVTSAAWIGRLSAAWQGGMVRLYALAMLIGLAVLVVLALLVGVRA